MEENKYLDITCKIMNAAMKGESLDLSAYDNDPEFLRIMKEQTFLPFLYEVDKRKIWRKYYYQAYLINEKFDAIGNKIKEIFDANNIDHIFLKGYELKKLYPKPWLRQMGDIDVLVREEDYERASELFKENNFIKGIDAYHHSNYKFKNIEIELHFKLLDDDNYVQFLTNPFDNATRLNKNTYFLHNEFNLMFLIIHYIKHLKKGAGLRELIDFYVFLNNKNINLNKLMEHLDKSSILAFWHTTLTELKYIFNFEKYSFQTNNYYKELINYCLRSGIHGNGDEKICIDSQYRNSKDSKFLFLLKKTFIPIKQLFLQYPWTKSIILIPLGYLVRIIYLIKNKNKAFKTLMNSKKDDNFFESIGIK